MAELVGGPADGELCALPLEQSLLPVARLKVPISRDQPRWLDESVVELTYDVGIYERGQISDRTHRWRYHWIGVR
jgi:hypothetical protein